MRRTTVWLVSTVVAAVISLGGSPVRAQQASQTGKHPRVAELESTLTNDASATLRGRFPGMPFLLTVSIDPLRRFDGPSGTADGARGTSKGEKLPYLDLADEEIVDEWDDPAVSQYALVSRVKKVVLTVSLPDSLRDEDLADVKTTLMARLNLNAARDEVSIQRRKWSGESSPLISTEGALGAAALAVALLCLFGIMRSASSRVASAVRDSATSAKPGAPAQSFSAPAAESPSGDRAGGGLAGDVRFNDPLRMREAVGQTARVLEGKLGFPCLQDILVLDRFGRENPRALGALIAEFSGETQKQMFAYSFGKHWLDALYEPGELSPDCLTTLDRLVRNVRDETQAEWQKLLIYAWRLDDELANFIKSLKTEESFAVLAHMPKGLAVGAARTAFPGNWGAVLDIDFKAPKLDEKKVKEIALRALQIRPLRDFGALEQYRQEKDLLEYLKTANPLEEREIYGAAPPQSMIHSLRPPFFAVFDLGAPELDALVPKLSVEDWSLALFNVLKGERREIESRFSEKQRFVYFERLKAFDQKPPSRERIGAVREKVARTIAMMKGKTERDDAPASERGSDAKAA